MARIKCDIIEDSDYNEDGYEVDCIRATCSKCGHETMSFGTSDASVSRCLVMMREECPEGESNYYVEDED